MAVTLSLYTTLWIIRNANLLWKERPLRYIIQHFKVTAASHRCSGNLRRRVTIPMTFASASFDDQLYRLSGRLNNTLIYRTSKINSNSAPSLRVYSKRYIHHYPKRFVFTWRMKLLRCWEYNENLQRYFAISGVGSLLLCPALIQVIVVGIFWIRRR